MTPILPLKFVLGKLVTRSLVYRRPIGMGGREGEGGRQIVLSAILFASFWHPRWSNSLTWKSSVVTAKEKKKKNPPKRDGNENKTDPGDEPGSELQVELDVQTNAQGIERIMLDL